PRGPARWSAIRWVWRPHAGRRTRGCRLGWMAEPVQMAEPETSTPRGVTPRGVQVSRSARPDQRSGEVDHHVLEDGGVLALDGRRRHEQPGALLPHADAHGLTREEDPAEGHAVAVDPRDVAAQHVVDHGA